VRLVECDELGNAWRIGQLLDALAHLASSQFDARVLERRGDGLLLSWPGHERRAAVCALQMSALADLLGRPGTDAAHAEPILLRFGLHCGNVLSDGQRVYGSDVNLAARVAALAAPGQVLMSQALRDLVNPGIDGDLVDLGDCWVKHAAAPVRVFRWQPADVRPQAHALPDAPLPCPCIAVLPFRMLALADPVERSTVADLVGENIVHALSSTDQLAVVSWFSTRMVDPQAVDLADIAQRLGAGWIVSGSCTGRAGQLVVAIELHDAHSRAVAWTARVPTTLADLMAAEPDFAREVAQGLVQRVCEGEARRLARHALPNLASHSILTGAIGLMHRSARDSFMKSREALEYLLERHPRMHAVRPWLAQWYVLRHTRGFGGDARADAARAIEQTRRALDALPDDARALALLGFAHFHLLDDLDSAEQHLDRSVQLNPNDPLALIFTAAVKSARDDPGDGLRLSANALRIAPMDPLRDYMRGIAAGCALSCGDLALAGRLAQASVRENAAHPYGWRVLLFASALQGDMATAHQAHQQLLQLGVQLTLRTYQARSKLRTHDLDMALRALRAVGVPEH
jgi:TolB-like protein